MPSLLLLVVLAASVLLLGAARRLWWSPLSRVPGPRLAAVTGLYEAYYDLVHSGNFPWQLQRLHRRYGRIVRITPTEVHIDDPSFAAVHLAGAGVKRHKSLAREADFGIPRTAPSTADADLHRMRRKPMAPYFTRQRVTAHEDLVRDKVDAAARHLERLQKTDTPMDLRLLFWCLIQDTVSAYAFPTGLGYLDYEELAPMWRHMVVYHFYKFNFYKHFHALWAFTKAKPTCYMIAKDAILRRHLDWAEANRTRVRGYAEAHARGEKVPEEAGIFRPMLTGDLPEHEKDFERLWEESVALLGAGTEGASNALSTIFFHLLRDPARLARLKEELRAANVGRNDNDPITFKELEKLPYLDAVILEGLRLSVGFIFRLIRVVTDQDVVYEDWVIPKGTAISMSSLLQHHNETIFPHAEEFLPERWLDGKADRNHLLTFSKGPRQCLGINLATSVMYHAVATIVQRVDLRLYETDVEDITAKHDGWIPLVRYESKGVRVMVQ